MAGWEYRVIHINVEPPRPSGAATSPEEPLAGPQPAGEGPNARPMFSQSFLQKEFPQFYEKPADGPSSAPSQHPAQQLQSFLNGHGAEGWELVGVFPVGTLTMMFFRRPKPSEPKSAMEASAPVAIKPVPEAEMLASPATGATAMGQDALGAILRRLDALEAKHPSTEAIGVKDPQTAPVVAPSPPPGDWVTAAQLASLAGETPLPSGQAALAIGLRSATSLANHGARYGYRPGLCKRGPNGQVAIYTGPGTAEKGGKERRLWIVVSAERLEG